MVRIRNEFSTILRWLRKEDEEPISLENPTCKRSILLHCSQLFSASVSKNEQRKQCSQKLLWGILHHFLISDLIAASLRFRKNDKTYTWMKVTYNHICICTFVGIYVPDNKQLWNFQFSNILSSTPSRLIKKRKRYLREWV